MLFLWFGAASVMADTFDQVASTNNTAVTNVGHPVSFVPDEPIEALKAKAEKGDAIAQHNLGSRYFGGKGVPKDSAEALKWFLLAAKQGESDDQFWVGQCYETGSGVFRDYAEAAEWYLRAAKQGDLLGQSRLADLYANGMGVPKNNVEAYK